MFRVLGLGISQDADTMELWLVWLIIKCFELLGLGIGQEADTMCLGQLPKTIFWLLVLVSVKRPIN